MLLKKKAGSAVRQHNEMSIKIQRCDLKKRKINMPNIQIQESTTCTVPVSSKISIFLALFRTKIILTHTFIGKFKYCMKCLFFL